MLFKKRRRKDPLVAIQSSLSPGGSAAVLHSQPGILPGSCSLGWGAGTSTFVKAPSSVFMKIRNSALESLVLLPSLPACFWKTAIRDSMHRSVSVGLDTFAFGGKKNSGFRQGEDIKSWVLENTPQDLVSSFWIKAVS